MSATPFALRRAALLIITPVAAALAGCVTQVRVPAPAPAYVEPAAVEEIREPPPPLPVYEQPPCPEVGFIWTPGYWAWAPGGYYWVPGTWVAPPTVGVLWTPGYWGWSGGVYVWHAGYWGPHVGFYGGVNYGFGYGGSGYVGGRWVGNSFAYNTTVTNVNVTTVHNTYNETVINNVTVNNTTINRVSYSGGAGGAMATPTPQERMAAQESHLPPTPLQQHHVQQAAKNPDLFVRANGGHPAIAASTHPAMFTGPGVVAAKPPHPAQPAAPQPRSLPAAHPTVHPAVLTRPATQPAVAAVRPMPAGAVPPATGPATRQAPHPATAQKAKQGNPGKAPGRERRDENRG